MFVRIMIIAAVVLFFVLLVRAAVDVVRRRDLNAGSKAGWIFLMLILPFIGLLVYVMMRPSDAQIAKQARR